MPCLVDLCQTKEPVRLAGIVSQPSQQKPKMKKEFSQKDLWAIFCLVKWISVKSTQRPQGTQEYFISRKSDSWNWQGHSFHEMRRGSQMLQVLVAGSGSWQNHSATNTSYLSCKRQNDSELISQRTQMKATKDIPRPRNMTEFPQLDLKLFQFSPLSDKSVYNWISFLLPCKKSPQL